MTTKKQTDEQLSPEMVISILDTTRATMVTGHRVSVAEKIQQIIDEVFEEMEREG